MDPYAGVRERLGRGQPVVLDGGIGSELVRRGIRWRGHGLRTDAAAVGALHDEYLAAGADVIRTDTFQLNRRIYRDVFRDVAHMRRIGAPGLENRHAVLLRRAVEVARASRDRAGRPGVAIAGVIGPLEHCFRPDLAPSAEEASAEHAEIARLLAEAGVDLLLLESMNTLAEARLATAAAVATGRPTWVSFVVGPEGGVLGGGALAEAARTARAAGAEVVLVNCAPPEAVTRALADLAADGAGPRGAYAHIGKFDPPSWKFEFFPRFAITDEWPPDRYAAAAGRWRAGGTLVVGGCCGTGPAHVRALKAALAEVP